MILNTEKANENLSFNDKQMQALKEHFPACFKADGSFDVTRFKEELKDKVDFIHEGYELRFLGKSYAKLIASLDTTTVITPNTAHNVLPENAKSENIYISGDNLDGLKHLLKSYSKSIKCIYIDPPYNTGTDGFVYKDNFNFTADELQTKLSIDETQANRIIDLTRRNAASHSAWLMFMYPRLQLAKDLLKDDGVIFISIDDNEQANLKLLCDDIFGEENFVGQLPRITKKAGKTTDLIAKNNDYALCYSRTNNIQLNTFLHTDIGYKNEDEFIEERGKYKLSQTLDYGSIQYSQSLDYEIELNGEIFRPGNVSLSEMNERKKNNPKSDFCWRWSKELFNFGFKNGFIVVKESSNGKRIYTKTYQNAIIEKIGKEYKISIKERTKSATSLELIENKYSNDNARKDLDNLFETMVFNYSKPVELIKIITFISTDIEDTILDFFSGSATTAHAVMKLNAEDGGNRKFIAVQLPEFLDPNNPSQKNAHDFLKSQNYPTTLDYIGFERIKRAATKIKTETNAEIDYGFKHFILNEPNPNTLDKCVSFDKAGLMGDASILDEFGIPTVLTTWLNYDGYGFNAPYQNLDLNGYSAYWMHKHLYLIHTGFDEKNLKKLIEFFDETPTFNPENIVLFGYSFIEWSVTEMLEKNLKVLNDSEKNLKINVDVRY